MLGLIGWLGYVGARLVARFNLPRVTGFLIVGILLGPSVVGLLNRDILHELEFVEPLALGIIVFLIGEELTGRMLARHPWQFWFTSVLNVVLPTALVAGAVYMFRPEEPGLAWVLGVIAMSGAPATVMAVLTEKRARGGMCDTMLGCSALDNIACIAAYAAVVPYLQLVSGTRASVLSAIGETAFSLLGAIAIGVGVGWMLSLLLKRVADNSEMLAIALVHVVLAVAIADVAGVSVLLAPLVAGVTTATFEERRDATRRVFVALRAVEFPVYILFFTLAGANLELDAVVAGGLLVVVYILARSAGKFAGGFFGGLASRLSPKEASWFGLGMLPQAGVAVGLALNAAVVFPDIGPTINAVVLASIVFFELVGPVSTQKAIDLVANCDVELDDLVGESGEAQAAPKATVLVPVSHAFSRERLLFLLHMTSVGRPDARFVLTHIVRHDRPVTRAEGLRRGEVILQQLATAAEDAGFEVDTRLESSTDVGQTLSDLAEELGAELVVIGSGQERGLIRRSLVKTPMHRIIDEISAPVLVVPERFERVERSESSDEEGSVSLPEPPDTPVP